MFLFLNLLDFFKEELQANRHTKKMLVINYYQVLQIKTNKLSPHTCENNLFQKRLEISVGENVEEKEPSYTVNGNADWFSPYRR